MTSDLRWVGLVRNVMLGREGLHRDVLLALVEGVGGRQPRSFLTTGNVTFSAGVGDVLDVVDALEVQLARVLERHEIVVVRPVDWLRELLSGDPFHDFDDADWELEVCFVKDAVADLAQRLGDSGRTVLVEIRERELVTARPRSGPNRPHGNRLLEQATGQPATARGWSTLSRICATEAERSTG